MKIFISWSGDRSRRLAEVLHEWIPAVIQAAKPYYSPDDIAKGARWSAEISKELEAASVGLLCLTSENLSAPWIMFEAGALSKQIDRSRVCPILFDLEPSDVEGPLVQFQACRFGRDEIERVVRMINSELGEQALAPGVLDSVFDMWWPKLQERVAEVFATNQPIAAVSRSERDLLEEILALTRSADPQQYLVHRLDWIDDGMKGLTDALRVTIGLGAPTASFDLASAPTHSVRFRGAKVHWPTARQALYNTGRIAMIEVTHSEGLFDVTITTRGPLNRATIYRLLRDAGFEVLPRDSAVEDVEPDSVPSPS